MNSPLHSILIGTALGDSLGLPAENLSPEQIRKRWKGPWSHHFFLGRGMISDDTEHTVFVTQCLIEGCSDVSTFQHKLSWKFRWWLLCCPPGIGFATLRAIAKLWLGFSPDRSGVFSAGNGPAMRSAIIGGYFSGNNEQICDYVRASTRLTHTDPKAEIAALAVALVASSTMESLHPQNDTLKLIEIIASAGSQDEMWQDIVKKINAAHDKQLSVKEFALSLGLKNGVSGYAYHTVPIALYAWFKHFGDFRAGIEAVIKCGGDTDSVGAITGALLAINSEIPQEWIEGFCDYPISRHYIRNLGRALILPRNEAPPCLFPWMGLPIRNLFFLVIVLGHMALRLTSFIFKRYHHHIGTMRVSCSSSKKF